MHKPHIRGTTRDVIPRITTTHLPCFCEFRTAVDGWVPEAEQNGQAPSATRKPHCGQTGLGCIQSRIMDRAKKLKKIGPEDHPKVIC